MAAAAEEETLPEGFRFNPFDKELITHYLKPFILGHLRWNIIKERQVYGDYSNPWHVFDPNDDSLWFTSPDIKPTEKYTFAFARLSKISTSNTCSFKNTKKTAGCGTWVGMTGRDQITDDNNNVIGEKRYLRFKIKDVDSAAVGGVDLSQVGCFRMHEYSLIGVNSGLGSAANTTVLCKITHDSSKVCQIAGSSKAVKKQDNNNLESDGVKSENLTMIDCGGGGDNLDVKKEEDNNLESDSVISENLIMIDYDGGDNLDESKTFNSQSLVETNSDISDWIAAPQYNSGFQEVDELGGNVCFDDLDGYSFSLDELGFNDTDLGFNDTDWMGYLNFQQEEPLEDNTNNKPGKRKFELEENLHQAKKMCLELLAAGS